MSRHYPDRALIGQHAILAFLEQLGIRRLNGRPLTWRIVLAWRTCHACPILRGNRASSYKSQAFSTTHAVTSWCLSQFATGFLFKAVALAQPLPTSGSFTRTHAAA